MVETETDRDIVLADHLIVVNQVDQVITRDRVTDLAITKDLADQVIVENRADQEVALQPDLKVVADLAKAVLAHQEAAVPDHLQQHNQEIEEQALAQVAARLHRHHPMVDRLRRELRLAVPVAVPTEVLQITLRREPVLFQYVLLTLQKLQVHHQVVAKHIIQVAQVHQPATQDLAVRQQHLHLPEPNRHTIRVVAAKCQVAAQVHQQPATQDLQAVPLPVQVAVVPRQAPAQLAPAIRRDLQLPPLHPR